jgi:integrase
MNSAAQRPAARARVLDARSRLAPYRPASAIGLLAWVGLPVHFHSLRHTHATQLLAAGAHPRTMMERLGHSSVAFTLDVYSHVTERLRDDAAEKIDAVLRGR